MTRELTVNEIAQAERLARVETKLDTLLARFDPLMTDLEVRVRALEARVNRAAGMALLGGGSLGTIGGALISWALTR